MADEDDHEKTQIFLRPANSAAPAAPKPEEKAHEVVIKPARKAGDETRTAVDFDVTASGRAQPPAAQSAPPKKSSGGLMTAVAVVAIVAVVAAVMLLR
ncbi:MAG: hypothetical protein AB7Q81_07625 [Gammaproteobacteria bacterium]